MASMPIKRISTPPATAIPATYRDLLREVRAELFDGRLKIEHAWLQMYHRLGRLVHEHVLLYRDRANYATQTFRQLAADTGVSRRVLYEWVQLYRCFPIVRQSAQLTRTHYRLLCQVGDEKERRTLTANAIKHQWTTPELSGRVRSLNAAIDVAAEEIREPGTGAAPAAVRLLTPKRGIVGLRRIVQRRAAPGLRGVENLALDLGFKLYLPFDPAAQRKPVSPLAAGAIVQVDNDGRITVPAEARPSDLFTYQGLVQRVVDGDTLVVQVALPGFEMDEKLRLRGIDCPEMDTPEGKAAKRFVDSLLKAGDPIILCTTKPDKYDRYLADVYLQPRSGEELFLNNALLQNGHAIPMGVPDQAAWTP